MNLFRKPKFSLAILFSCLIILNVSPVVFAQSPQTSLLSWLPLLNSNLALFQPDQDCPQNKITNIKTRKEGNRLDIDIGTINWDLACQANQSINSDVETPLSFTLHKEQIDNQINELFDLLTAFPVTNIDLKSVEIASPDLLHDFTFSLLLKKTQHMVLVTLQSELLNVELKINILDRKLTLDSEIELDKVSHFIKIAVEQQELLNNKLILSYASDLSTWNKGRFSSNWQGELGDLAELAQLNIAGELDLLTTMLNIDKFEAKLSNVIYPLSENQNWSGSYIKLNLSNPALINWSSQQAQALPLQLRIGRSELLTKVLRGEQKRVRVDKQKLPPIFSAFRAQGDIENMLVDWRLSLLNQTLKGKVAYQDNIINLAVEENKVSVKTLVESLQGYVSSLDLLEITHGDINLQSSVSYDLNRKTGSLSSKVTAFDIEGKNNDLSFDGVSFDSELDYVLEEGGVTIKQDRQGLKIANLFVGFPIQALQMDAQLNAGKPIIEHFKARLLGGRVNFDDFEYSPPSQTLVNISGISLKELIKYSAYPEIKSKGIIDGVLPLSLDNLGVHIIDGDIFARSPGGYIKVPETTVIKTIGKSNPAFSYTMQLLSDFQFDTLQGVVAYTADGESDFKIELKGISPNISGTQAITFNYSHQENILKLLKSLRFNAQLEQQIKENY